MGFKNIISSTSKLSNFTKPSLAGKVVNNVKFYSVASEQVIHSSYSNVNVPEKTFGKYMLEKFEQFAPRTALINGDTKESWTFSQLRDKTIGLSKSLTKLDISKGDIIAILSPNCPEYLPSLVAPAILGASVTTINSTYTPEEIERQLLDSDAQIVICHFALYGLLKKACNGNKNIRHIIVIGKDIGHGLSINKLFTQNGENFSQSTEIDPEDLFLLPYSSGTTGLPKGVMLTHKNIIANLEQISHPDLTKANSVRGETFIGLLPMFHSYGMTTGLFACATLGGRMVTVSKFDAQQYVDCLVKYKPTFIHAVPQLLAFLVGHKDITSSLLSETHTVMSGADRSDNELVKLFIAKFGKITYQEGYGMTEASPVTHMTPINASYVAQSCGTCIPNTSTKVIKTNSEEATNDDDECGELCIKGPQVMKGYFKNTSATEAMLSTDGWLRTGDLAKIDEDGNVFIINRLKELLKVKGLQVAPAELEEILRKYPNVAEVAVIGVPHDRWGEVPRAYIVPKPGAKLNISDIIDFHDGKVAPHKRLEGGIKIIREMPKSPTGKILKRMLE